MRAEPASPGCSTLETTSTITWPLNCRPRASCAGLALDENAAIAKTRTAGSEDLRMSSRAGAPTSTIPSATGIELVAAD